MRIVQIMSATKHRAFFGDSKDNVLIGWALMDDGIVLPLAVDIRGMVRAERFTTLHVVSEPFE